MQKDLKNNDEEIFKPDRLNDVFTVYNQNLSGYTINKIIMKKYFLVILLLVSFQAFSQIDTAYIAQLKSLETINTLQYDTVAVPEDAFTKKIRKLRIERSGFDIETLIRVKLMEEEQKDKVHSKEFYDKLLQEVTQGSTSKLIDRAIINLYRNAFTEKEVDQLIKFYKTPAGKKMNKEFILLMLRSAKDVEALLKLAAENIKS